MNERLKQARIYLNLSQEFVARQMNLPRPAISAIESGQRKVSTEELKLFTKLYGVSADELLYGPQEQENKSMVFARTFSELDKQDQQEILNLIDFKRRYREHING
jgi:transcriptional regulator with XRE-family HTH domain